MYKRRLIAFICIAAIVLMQIPAVTLAADAFSLFTNTIAAPSVEGMTVASSTDTTTNHFTISMDINMTQEQWKKAFAGYSSGANISIPFVLHLPDAAQVYSIGTSAETTDTQAISYLNSGNYDPLDASKKVMALVDIASVSYKGTTAIITPINRAHSFCLKWKNDSGEYFHRFNFNITQTSMEACRINDAAPEPNRIALQTGTGITGSYGDGVVNYLVGSFSASIETFVKTPEGATQLFLNGQSAELVTKGVNNGYNLAASVPSSLTTRIYKLQWKDAANNIVKTESLTVVIASTTNELWLSKVSDPAAVPVPGNRMGLASGAQRGTTPHHLKYDATKGEWRFKADENYGFDEVALCGREWIFRITPPTGAVSYKIVDGTHPLNAAGYENNIKNLLANVSAQNIADTYTDNGALTFTLDGDILSKATLAGSAVTVYTVNKTMPGYGSWMVFQWFDGNGVSTTEYVYLVKEAFVKETVIPVRTSEPDSTVNDPTAVLTGGGGFRLKTQTPLQPKKGANAWSYQLNNLKFIDAAGNEVLPGGNVDVYLPYPSGMNFNNANSFELTLRHYNDDTYTTYTDITLVPTEHGLEFITDSFSPFLLGWKAHSVGVSSSVYSGSKPSFSYPLQDTQVSATAGTSASMSVSVSGSEPLTYRWQINRGSGWSDIDGATGLSYSASDVALANDGYQYRCIASNSYGTATSNVFTLDIAGAVGIPATGDRPDDIWWLAAGLLLAALMAGTAIKRKQQR